MQFFSKNRLSDWLVLVLVAAALLVSARLSAQTSGTLTAEELAVEAPADASTEVIVPPPEPIEASAADSITIEPLVERGYLDEQGRYVLDLIESDIAYVAVVVATEAGRPVRGAALDVSVAGTSRLLEPLDVSVAGKSDEQGIAEFAVIAGKMGLDRITVEYRDVSIEVLVNVLSTQAREQALPSLGAGFLLWEDLMAARVEQRDMTLYTDFPAKVAAQSGEIVKMAGFMTPLETGMKQQHFLLTSHPPGCYFHLPGGPAGAVEVFAPAGVSVSWGPVFLQGKFVTIAESDGAVYRLDDAALVDP
ncbi:MAG: hypothetical protein AAAFM81_12145 [Pseudomonadota bacterium]